MPQQRSRACLRQRNVAPAAFRMNATSAKGPAAMPPQPIDPNMTVDEIMRRWPGTIRVMIRHKMLCIGCPFGVFHTVADACAAHEVDAQAFGAELHQAIEAGRATSAPSAFAPSPAVQAAGDGGRGEVTSAACSPKGASGRAGR